MLQSRLRRLGIQFTHALVCYVYAIADTWAYMIDSNALERKDEIALFCNPMATLRHCIKLNSEAQQIRVQFSLEIDDEATVGQMAVLLIALDSFVAIVSRGRLGPIILKERDPNKLNLEWLLAGNGQCNPAGYFGAFECWQYNNSIVDDVVQYNDCASLKPLFVQPPPNERFSIFMTEKETRGLAKTCFSIKGPRRMKSLLCRYASFVKRMKVDDAAKWWTWGSRLPLQRERDSLDKLELELAIECKPSTRLAAVESVSLASKSWVQSTVVLLQTLKKNTRVVDVPPITTDEKSLVPLVGPKAVKLSGTLKKSVKRLHSVVRRKVKFRLPKSSSLLDIFTDVSTPSDLGNAGLGLTVRQYKQTIQVMDTLLGEGAFYTAALNHLFFNNYEENDSQDGEILIETWPKKDLARLVDLIIDNSSDLQTELKVFREVSTNLRTSRTATDINQQTRIAIAEGIKNNGAYITLTRYTSKSA